MTLTAWQAYLSAHPNEWHQVAADVPFDRHTEYHTDLGLDPRRGYGHAAEAVQRDPDDTLTVIHIWGIYADPDDPDPPEPVPQFEPAAAERRRRTVAGAD